MRIDDIEDNETRRTNPYDYLNLLLENHGYSSDGDSSDDSLDGDILVDEDDDFKG